MKNVVIAKQNHTGWSHRLAVEASLVATQVLRWGKCDFSSDGSFDATNEEQVSVSISCPDLSEQDWYYYEGGFHSSPQGE